jgi:hypothetical protein
MALARTRENELSGVGGKQEVVPNSQIDFQIYI